MCTQLSIQLGTDTVKSWIEPLHLGCIGEDKCVVIYAPTAFVKDRIDNHYLIYINNLWMSLNAEIKGVSIQISQEQPIIEKKLEKSPKKTSTDEKSFDNFLDSRYTFENFVVGKSNELAYTAAMRVAESEHPQFNPLFLYGGVGLGKTHLMHAIAWRVREFFPQKKVVYLSAEKFMYLFIQALRDKEVMSFKDQFRTTDVLMIDDIQFIGGKDNTQEEFFHTFNALVDQNRQIIVSADKSPTDLENIEERLKSRLGWGLVADIHPTTYELRLSILDAKVHILEAHVPTEVLEFLALKIKSNVRELEGALNRVHAYTKFTGKLITLDGVQNLLKDLIKSHEYQISIDEIQRRVSEFYNIKLTEMLSDKRQKRISTPRQVAMYLCKQLTTKSLPEIGRKFSGKDHTTVLHAIRKIEDLRTKDLDFAKDINTLLCAMR